MNEVLLVVVGLFGMGAMTALFMLATGWLDRWIEQRPEKPKRKRKAKRKHGEEWRDLEDMLPDGDSLDPNELQFDPGWDGAAWQRAQEPMQQAQYGEYLDSTKWGTSGYPYWRGWSAPSYTGEPPVPPVDRPGGMQIVR